MKTWMLQIAGFVLPLLLLIGPAAAAPIYSVNAGTLSYTNAFLGFGLSDSFSFTGPQPVSIQGSGATAVANSTLQSLGVPFNLTFFLIIDDTGNESGNASANGINYGASEYLNGAFLTNSSPFVLTAGHLTVSVPATVSGQLDVCTPDANCPGGSNPGGSHTNPFDVAFGPLPGTLTATYTLFNFGTQYTLTSAVFTTAAPEPSTWMLAIGAFALFAIRELKNRTTTQT